MLNEIIFYQNIDGNFQEKYVSLEGTIYQKKSYYKSNLYFTSKLYVEVQNIFRGFWSFRFLKRP